MKRLRVLITNHRLAARGGTELYVRDIAMALQERGHSVAVYTSTPGALAAELRAATIPVVDDPAALGEAPDVIHGQHHLDTMAALLAFPGVPAVSVCHGWLPWIEAPPRFPRVRRYVAVDAVCRDRLVLENGIAPERVHTLLNFVDLSRFPARPPLPARPRRALVFSGYTRGGGFVPPIRAACEREGIRLDVVGVGEGNTTGDPGRLLAGYDVVFAKGRSALEALAVGAAVIPCDAAGMGPLVTSGNWRRLRTLNFGVRTLRSAVTEAGVRERLRLFDTDDAARVSAAIRASAGHWLTVDELVEVYRAAIADERAAPSDPADELRAASAYLRSLTPRFHERSLLVSLLRRTPIGSAIRAALAAHSVLGRESTLLARLDRALGDRE
ncbi:MAG TPA: glycosyltransferase family 4 protein [Longimicrobium sp.]|nr:glycosyltransferase family 4 protein [Longimicrobium sp.]